MVHKPRPFPWLVLTLPSSWSSLQRYGLERTTSRQAPSRVRAAWDNNCRSWSMRRSDRRCLLWYGVLGHLV
jgi:hypothetical protein